MRGWGQLDWGLHPWGIGYEETSTLVGPQIVYRYPLRGQNAVSENELVQVQFFHPSYTLNPESIQIYVQETLYYDGKTGFQAGAVGHVQTLSGVTSVQFYTPAGFEFGLRTYVRARAADADGNALDETWSFVVRDNPMCYSGLTALPVEVRLQRPYQTFLAFEEARALLLASALRKPAQHVAQEGSKAARVIYQLAFSTELATLQNKYRLRNDEALEVIVCEKQNTLELDKKMMFYRDRLDDGLDDFKKYGIFSDDYVKSFHEYLASPNYQYRMSLIANLVLYAAAYELNA